MWSFFFWAVSSFLPYKVWSHTKESGEFVHLYLKTLRDLREFLADQTFPLSQTSPFINEEQRGWLPKVTISEWKRWDSNQVLCLLFCLQSSSLRGSSSGNSEDPEYLTAQWFFLRYLTLWLKNSVWEAHNLLECLYFIWTLNLFWLIIPFAHIPLCLCLFPPFDLSSYFLSATLSLTFTPPAPTYCPTLNIYQEAFSG